MIQRLLEKKHSKGMPTIFGSFILLSLHAFLIVYINSSFLEQFVTPDKVGLLFSLGALLTLIILFFAPLLIRKVGAY